jgi:16S rRNA (guanine966-N2)-methyltransferase
MRIVGGRLKGRALAAPSSRAIRPTSERLRESIFDILEHRYSGHVEGQRVVDLFAGSGALAIEALSRGARFALFVDNGAEARALLRANVEALGLGGVTRIWRADAAKLGSAPSGGPFGLSPDQRSQRSSRGAGSSRTRSASSKRLRRPRSRRRRGSC